ncbi:MAG: DUF2442 domain-containing protein [Chloroflexota bacterium]|nr:DUF2442 domain-containing protein [Chloroflexota bacterium]
MKCDDESIDATFDDGRTLSLPIAGLAFLRRATSAERRDCRVCDRGTGIYWPKLDEVMGVDVILGVPEDEVLDLIS